MKISPSFNGKSGSATEETEQSLNRLVMQKLGLNGENTGLNSVNVRRGYLVGRA